MGDVGWRDQRPIPDRKISTDISVSDLCRPNIGISIAPKNTKCLSIQEKHTKQS